MTKIDTAKVRFLCNCGAEWINANHNRCEGCGRLRGQLSIGMQSGYEMARSDLDAAEKEIGALKDDVKDWTIQCEGLHEDVGNLRRERDEARRDLQQRDVALQGYKQMDREYRDLCAENERLRAVAEAAKLVVSDCEISGPTHVDPPEFVPPHVSTVTELARALAILAEEGK